MGFKGCHAKNHLLATLSKPNQFLFQKYVTQGVQLSEEHLHWKLTHAKDHLDYLRKYGENKSPTCLELGTGWYPIIPIMLYLHGAKEVQTVDLNAHLTEATLQTSIEKILALKESGALDDLFPDIQDDRWFRFKQMSAQLQDSTLEENLRQLQIKALVTDARSLSIPDGTFDFISSNNTFEHIFPEVLSAILQEFKRVLKPGGTMSHFIDLSDHFAHFDQSITIYNFLRFSSKQWSWIDNVIQPQNRWRWPQYKALYKQLGIPITKENVRSGDVKILRTVSIHSEWESFTEEELAISHGYLVTMVE